MFLKEKEILHFLRKSALSQINSVQVNSHHWSESHRHLIFQQGHRTHRAKHWARLTDDPPFHCFSLKVPRTGRNTCLSMF